MNQIAVKLVVCVLLGAVVNVAVAWACAYWIPPSAGEMSPTGSDPTTHPYFSLGDDLPRWVFMRRNHAGATTLVWQIRDAGSYLFVPEVYEPGVPPQWARVWNRSPASPQYDQNKVWLLIEDARGWPFRALRCEIEVGPLMLGAVISDIRGGVALNARMWPWRGGGKPMPDRAALPFEPLWPGFALNTVFYAVVVWALWSALLAVRGVIRQRRRRCVRCGYDLRGAVHDACPECGGKVVQVARERAKARRRYA